MKTRNIYAVGLGALFGALFFMTQSAAALPGSSVYPKPDHKIWEKVKGNNNGPVPCAACHLSSPKYEKNVYIDIRDAKGKSLVSNGEANVPFKPGETTEVNVVVGLKTQDKTAKHAGWFLNLPLEATLANGSVNYCYQRINYPIESEFSVDGKPYLTGDRHYINFGQYAPPQSTEIWVGVGSRSTDTKAGSDARKETLGLKSMKINWVKDDMM